jgi:hypothetical protein
MYKTGDEAPETGNYVFVRFVNGNVNCTPTANERNIPLKKGATFPPIRSCNAGAWYRKA